MSKKINFIASLFLYLVKRKRFDYMYHTYPRHTLTDRSIGQNFIIVFDDYPPYQVNLRIYKGEEFFIAGGIDV
jgi:hypothetical protein